MSQTPRQDPERLSALRDMVSGDPELLPALEDAAHLAAALYDVPMATVTVVNGDQQHSRVRIGPVPPGASRVASFSGHVARTHEALMVSDARNDPLFKDTPLVTEEPHVRFYAGAPIRTRAGVVGALCVLDTATRKATPTQLEALQALARQVASQVELRLNVAEHATRIRNAGVEQDRLAAQSRRLEADYSALEQLHRITSSILPLEAKIHKVLQLGLETFQMDLAILSRVEDEEYTVLHAAARDTPPARGTTFTLGDTYCLHTLAAAGPTSFYHAKEQLHGHPCYEKFRLEAYLGAPIEVAGETYGTINFSSPSPRPAPFMEGELALVRHFAQWAGAKIQLEQQRKQELHMARLRGVARSSVAPSQSGLETDLWCLLAGGGRIKGLGPGWRRVLGIEPRAHNGRPLPELVHPEDVQALSDALGSLTTGDAITGLEGRFRRADGQYRWLHCTALKEPETGHVFAAARDITEHKQMEQMKANFISTVSHELRTPVTSIRGALELAINGVVGDLPPKALDLLQLANRNAARMVRLVNDILDEERLGSGRLRLNRSRQNLRSLVEEAVENNKPYAANHGVVFQLHVKAAKDAAVLVDPDRIHQVLDNLLSNAAKYAAESGSVEVRVEDVAECYRVSVQDHGPGVPEDFRPYVFTRFAQSDTNSGRSVAGTGLGLSIAKSLVELHQGTLAFETAVGEGTTFYFDLPRMHARVLEQD